MIHIRKIFAILCKLLQYKESTRGAHNSLRLKGIETKLNKASPSKDTFLSFKSKGMLPDRPIGIPCKVYKTNSVNIENLSL